MGTRAEDPATVLPPVSDAEAQRRAVNGEGRWTKITGPNTGYLPRNSADIHETCLVRPGGAAPTHTKSTEF